MLPANLTQLANFKYPKRILISDLILVNVIIFVSDSNESKYIHSGFFFKVRYNIWSTLQDKRNLLPMLLMMLAIYS